MIGTRSERRSVARRNASQTRPDQTRVFVTAVCGVSGSKSIHLTVTYPTRRAWMAADAAVRGGC